MPLGRVRQRLHPARDYHRTMSVDELVWDNRYPDREILRREIAAMTDAFVHALFSVFPQEAIAGVYAKGSARKPWDSPLDYVPELSDVDVHVLFADDEPEMKYFPSVEIGVAMQRELEGGYLRRIAMPTHVPRMQLVVANALYREPNFIHSVPHTVTTLFGSPYPQPQVDATKSLAAARTNLLMHEPYLTDLGEHLADKVGGHVWEILRPMNWRVGPTGPRVLELRGMPFLDAWGANRTEITGMLRTIGEAELAADYTTFYIKGWEYFLSNRRSSEAARQAILAGSRVLARGIAIVTELTGDGADGPILPQ
jgi:hypothetical protein